jgi:divalent metal cation (Fe/Co/Zn/Cd) transporter
LRIGGIFGAQVGFAWLDPVGGLVVAGMIMKAAVHSSWEAILELLDEQPRRLNKRIHAELLRIQVDSSHTLRFHLFRNNIKFHNSNSRMFALGKWVHITWWMVL